MNGLYTMLACCFCVAVASCRKCETLYHQSYDVTYFQHADSFVAVAYFHSNIQTGDRVLLSQRDAVFFNSRPADNITEQTYIWTGEGKTDVRFVLSKKERQLITSEAGSRFANLGLACPDTISQAMGRTISIKYETGQLLYVYIVDAGNNIRQLEMINASACLTPEILAGCPEGPMIIGIVETIPGKVMCDGDMSGTFNYHLVYEKSVYCTR